MNPDTELMVLHWLNFAWKSKFLSKLVFLYFFASSPPPPPLRPSAFWPHTKLNYHLSVFRKQRHFEIRLVSIKCLLQRNAFGSLPTISFFIGWDHKHTPGATPQTIPGLGWEGTKDISFILKNNSNRRGLREQFDECFQFTLIPFSVKWDYLYRQVGKWQEATVHSSAPCFLFRPVFMFGVLIILVSHNSYSCHLKFLVVEKWDCMIAEFRWFEPFI